VKDDDEHNNNRHTRTTTTPSPWRIKYINMNNIGEILLPVVAEVILAAEGLSANVTRVGPFVGVGPLVDEQIVGLGELAVAELADELLLGSGSAAGSAEETRVVLARVERREVAGTEPRAHEERDVLESVRVLETTESGLLGGRCILLAVVGGNRSGIDSTFLLFGVLGCVSGQLGQVDARLQALEHGRSFEHGLRVVVRWQEILLAARLRWSNRSLVFGTERVTRSRSLLHGIITSQIGLDGRRAGR
jgi:hypothetical protein